MVDSSNKRLFMKATGLSYVPISLGTLFTEVGRFCFENQLTWCLEPGDNRGVTCFSILPELHTDWAVSIESFDLFENIILAVSVAYSNINRHQEAKILNMQEWRQR